MIVMGTDDNNLASQSGVSAFDQAHDVLCREGHTLDIDVQDRTFAQIQNLRLKRFVDAPLDVPQSRNDPPANRLGNEDDGYPRISGVFHISHGYVLTRIARTE